MSWTAVYTFTVGAVLTAAQLNTYLRDNTSWLGGSDGNTKAGTLSIPAQPAFLAYKSSDSTNQTGNGTAVTVGFDTEVFDQANNFASNTFTAPITGRYALQAQVTLSNLSVAMSGMSFVIVTSNRSYRTLPNVNVETAGNTWVLGAAVEADMDAADTATVSITVFDGAGNTATISGNANMDTRFSGHLVA